MLDRDEKMAMAARKHWSAAYTGFWMDSPGCAADGCGEPSEPPHHIRTRGAGGSDDSYNLLPLCVSHHREIHTIGCKLFMFRHPRTRGKITRALGTPKAVRLLTTAVKGRKA